MPLPATSVRTSRNRSSAIRDILHHARQPGVISLAGGIPAAETFPRVILADATEMALADGVTALQYGLTGGEAAYREVFAQWTGVDPMPELEQIVVTTGWTSSVWQGTLPPDSAQSSFTPCPTTTIRPA